MGSSHKHYIGVDVGTSSVRAALVTSDGEIKSSCKQPITIYAESTDHYAQSSEEIWRACIICIQKVVSHCDVGDVSGIGFDATCSLVVLDQDKKPLSVEKSGDKRWNVIMWMDHRARKEAQSINNTCSESRLVRQCGGTISLEMETPKLLWLKHNLPEVWDKAYYLLDLADFLAWKATQSDVYRSISPLVTKWPYVYDENGIGSWDSLEKLGIEKSRFVGEILSPGEPILGGLSDAVAEQFTLNAGTPIGAAMVDAHAGALGCFGMKTEFTELDCLPISSRLAMVCGTSTCHMAVSDDYLPVSGVWGPYYSSLFSGMWMIEAGQSATGKLLDFIISSHPYFAQMLKENPKLSNRDMHSIIEVEIAKTDEEILFRELRNVHIVPDFHGNRSPLADPELRGMVSGLTFSTGKFDLLIKYLSAVYSLAYGTKHIIETLCNAGFDIKVIHLSGGLAMNPLYVQAHADVTDLPVIIPEKGDMVLVGASMLGAKADGLSENLKEVVNKMGRKGKVIWPSKKTRSFHAKRYLVFRQMLSDQLNYRKIMSSEMD